MKTRVVFSRQSDEWETPQGLFDQLNDEFHFTLDPCASDENHKCESYFTKEDDGLQEKWGGWCSAIHHIHKSNDGFKRRMKKQNVVQPLSY